MSEFEVNQQCSNDKQCMCNQYPTQYPMYDQNPTYGQYPMYGIDPWQDYQQNDYNYYGQNDRCPYCGRPYGGYGSADIDDIDATNLDYHQDGYDNYESDQYGYDNNNDNYNDAQGSNYRYGYGYGYRYPYRGCGYPGCGYRFGFPFFNFPFRRRRRIFPFFF